MKHYIIIENIEDHIGYNGQIVTIKKELPDNYYEVEDGNGNVWTCGEEELQAFQD